VAASDETRIGIMNAPAIFAGISRCGQLRRSGGEHRWKSYRHVRAPAHRIPDFFRSWSDYDEYAAARQNRLNRQRKKIWWDVRPHAFFLTLEYRVCACRCASTTICLAAPSGRHGQTRSSTAAI
jgi:hypothetical protein